MLFGSSGPSRPCAGGSPPGVPTTEGAIPPTQQPSASLRIGNFHAVLQSGVNEHLDKLARLGVQRALVLQDLLQVRQADSDLLFLSEQPHSLTVGPAAPFTVD
jgi:hypothetical protein